MKKNALFLRIAASLIIITNICFAGNLDPSASPGSTMKPLDQVEPRTPITSLPLTISQSGSYYLTKNFTTPGTAITINVDDVTIDLCGFTLTGPANSAANYGIYMNGRKNIEIINGTIRDFGYDGILENSSIANNHRIVNVTVSGNGRSGIQLYSSNDLVKDCTIYNNGRLTGINTYGIYEGHYGTIVNNRIYSNSSAVGTSYCIYVGVGNKIIGNTLNNNGVQVSGNVYAINCNTANIISDNVIYSNGGSATGNVYGIYANGTGCMITGNNISSNGSLATGTTYGIHTNDQATIANNTIRGNSGNGIRTTGGCSIINNVVASNTSTGITAGDNTKITGNTVTSSGADGIVALDHVTITDNTVTSSSTNGIACTGGYIAKNTISLNNTSSTAARGGLVVAYHSQIKENTLEGNTKNNILITGYRNQVENNYVSGSDYGINFTSTGNIYLNNRGASNGTNYNSAGNTDGGGNVSF